MALNVNRRLQGGRYKALLHTDSSESKERPYLPHTYVTCDKQNASGRKKTTESHSTLQHQAYQEPARVHLRDGYRYQI